MRIAYLATGAGSMVCGTCLHDNTLAAALLAAGEEVLLVPTYTPLRTDETNVSLPRVRFGGINLYLQEKLPLLRYLPRPLRRMLDAGWLLRLASRSSSSVDAAQLGRLTVSVLEGEAGRIGSQVVELVDWLADEVRPEVVHLSNMLQIGLAREIKRRLGCPVVCGLSGEDAFFDHFAPEDYEAARRTARERADDVDAFVAMNHYYAQAMAEYLAIDRSRIEVIPHGLLLAGHAAGQARAEGVPGGMSAEMSAAATDGALEAESAAMLENARPVVLGYFARIHPDKGLHHLVEAFITLATDRQLPPLKLVAAGYMAPGERAYLQAQQTRLAAAGLSEQFAYHGELSRQEKIAFLRSLDLMCLPTVYRESKGLSVLEALANGVGVVVPRHGTFPELAEATHGLVLHEPESSTDLTETLRQLILSPQSRRALGAAGQAAIAANYNDRLMAERTTALYRLLVTQRQPSTERQ